MKKRVKKKGIKFSSLIFSRRIGRITESRNMRIRRRHILYILYILSTFPAFCAIPYFEMSSFSLEISQFINKPLNYLLAFHRLRVLKVTLLCH